MELPTYNLGELSPVDIRAYLEEKDVVMIPIASLEQHGPHLPLLTDTIQAEQIARRAAQRAQVLYTPTVWMGYSPQHMYEPGQGTGTITIRPNLLLELWYDVGRSLIHHGFNKLVFVNNHGSNAKIIEPLLRRLRYDTGALVTMSRLYGERYLALIDDVMENPPEETPGWHSSELETSQVMAHDESLVRMDRAVVAGPDAARLDPGLVRQARRRPRRRLPGLRVLPVRHRPPGVHAVGRDRQPAPVDGGEGRAHLRALRRTSRRRARRIREASRRGPHARLARACLRRDSP